MLLSLRQQFSELNRLKLKPQFDGFSSEILYWGFFNGLEWWRNYLHLHSFFEICYVLKGEGSFTIQEKSHKVSKGDVFIAKPNERHEIISSETKPLAIYFWSYTLVPPNQANHGDLSKLFYAFSESREAVVTNQKKLLHILNNLTREISHKDIAYATIIEGLVKQLLIETARSCTHLVSRTKSLAHGYQDSVVDTIRRYLRDNYAKSLKLKEIAAQVHLSERHISRLFKAVTGSSIKHYVTELRMDNAKQLLLDKALSISEVAYETGYQDLRHFSTVFRQQTGSSPSQYRKQGGTKFL